MWEADESRLGPPCARAGEWSRAHAARGLLSRAGLCPGPAALPRYPAAQRIKPLAVSAAPALGPALPSRRSDGSGILPCVTPLERFLSQAHVIA